MATKRQGTSVESVKKRFSLAHDYKKFFQTDSGKRILHDLMKTHHVMGSTYVKGDPMMMALQEGERNVVLRIFAVCAMEPAEMQRQITEATKNAKNT